MHLWTRAAALRLVIVLLAAIPAALRAQQPTRPDSAARDSAQRLETIEVTVTRTPEPLERVPAAVSVLGKTDIRRGQATLGLDESLNDLPGVYVANRYNFSLDQRLSIRGFGSRSSFGTRGVKILLDGVPQTLPDGQSQLTNVEFGSIGRIEVLRGSASSLYGNASGGMRFTRFYAISSVCSPTRAALLSGRNHINIELGKQPWMSLQSPREACSGRYVFPYADQYALPEPSVFIRKRLKGVD